MQHLAYGNAVKRFAFVSFDTNGTLIKGHSSVELARLVGREKQVAGVVAKQVEGKMGMVESMREIARLLRGLEVSDTGRLAKKIELMPGALETCRELKKRGYRLLVISTGFNPLLRSLGDRLGIDTVVANDLVVDKKGLATGGIVERVVAENAKMRILKEILREQGSSPSHCIAVGDSATDISMFITAGYSIAFNAKEAIVPYADRVVEGDDLTKILDVLPQ